MLKSRKNLRWLNKFSACGADANKKYKEFE